MENQSDTKVPDIKEAYKNLHIALGEDSFKQYSALLRLYFSAKLTKVKFDEEARKLLITPDHLHLHNLFLLSLSTKINNSSLENYDTTASSIKYCNQEMCLPNEDLIKARMLITSVDHGLDGAEDAVTDIIVLAIQMFIKNILTATLSRTRGYKIRENNFQHAIGLPAPNPWLRNTNNIIDPTQESNINVNEEEQSFEPKIRPNLEAAEQQTAFGFACGSQNSGSNRLTLRNLYDTLLENPNVINNHTINSIGLERILAMLDCS